MAMNLQLMRQGFENLRIKSDAGVQDYITQVGEVLNQMKVLGDTISKAMMVRKVLKSMGAKYNHIVTGILLSPCWMS